MKTRQRAWAWIGDTIAILILVAAAVSPHLIDALGPNSMAVSFLTVLSAAVLPFRRRWPIPAFVVVASLFAVSTVLGAPTSGVVLAVAIVLFRVAAFTSRRTTVIAACVAVGIMVVGWLVFLAIQGEFAFEPRLIQAALTIVTGGAAGDATRSRRETIESITDRAVRAEQTRESEATRRVALERLSIARDLHDAVAHQIAVISLNAGVASSSLETRPETAKEALVTIRTASREVLSEIGDLLHMLRSGDDTDGPQSAAPQPGFDQIDDLAERFRAVGLQIDVASDGDSSGVPSAVGIVAYRLVQEALTNAHKHGAERSATVRVAVGDDAVTIEIANPIGPRPSTITPVTGGHGLVGMRERVASVRGTMTAQERHGAFVVSAELPRARREAP